MHSSTVFLALLGVAALTLIEVQGHGRLWQPIGRASLWRFPQFSKYNPPINYNDMELFCGGADVQNNQNGGNCGICGDNYADPQPRRNEGGGLFGRGIIAATYTAGQIVDVLVDLTASHLGYFEFRLCPQNNPLVPATQECLDQHLLELADGSGTRYPILTFDNVAHTVPLRLPQNLTCDQCVFQWHYKAGNSHGLCDDGSWQMGCGAQETFRSCSDVRIVAAAESA